ncbi:hypothetical protein ACFHWW_03970 [Ensifer sp. P24N7]
MAEFVMAHPRLIRLVIMENSPWERQVEIGGVATKLTTICESKLDNGNASIES